MIVKKVCWIYCLFLLFGTYQSCKTPDSANSGNGEIQLLTQNDPSWKIVGTAAWTWEDGIMTGSGGEGYVASNEEFDNFILEVEFYPERKVNSGIFIRCPRDEQSATNCYEINIWDEHVNQDFRTGSIVTHGKPLQIVHTLNKWNNYKIEANGDKVSVWLNDILTAELKDSKSNSRGGLELHKRMLIVL